MLAKTAVPTKGSVTAVVELWVPVLQSMRKNISVLCPDAPTVSWSTG